MSDDAAFLPDDPQALKALVLQLQGSLRAHDLRVQALRLQIARLKRQKFGARSQKIAREIEPLELALEGLQVAQADVAPAVEPVTTEITPVAPETEGTGDEPLKAPRRRPRVAPDTRRERREIDPGDRCPDCGGTLRLMGEDVRQIPEMIAARMKVIDVARLKKSCCCCERMVQCPAPSRRSSGNPSPGWFSCPPHPRQSRRVQPFGLHPGLQIRRPSAALSPERDLRPQGCRHSRQHPVGLVWRHHDGADAAGRSSASQYHGLRPLACPLSWFAGKTIAGQRTPPRSGSSTGPARRANLARA